MFNFKRFFKSFHYAIQGVHYALNSDQNLVFHFFMAIFVIILSIILKVNPFEMGILGLTILVVIATEMINSAIEKMVDLITKEHRAEAKIAKDVSAGMVLITSIGSAIIGFLIFLIAGVAGPTLPSAFALPAAWGDFAAAVLAILALIALTKRWKLAFPLVWFFNIWGTIDLLFAFYNGPAELTDAGQFGATFYIVTLIVPMLLVAHFLIFKLLLQSDSTKHRKN